MVGGLEIIDTNRLQSGDAATHRFRRRD